MKTLQSGQTVKYIGGLFPELEEEDYAVVQVYPGTFVGVHRDDMIVEVMGNKSYNMFKKHRFDFEAA